MIMNFTPEQIASTNKAGVEAILGLAHTQFAAFERLSALYFNAAKAAFEEGVGHAKALLNAKDPQEYLTLNAAATQPTMEKAIAYSRGVYEVAAQTNGELAKFLEAQAAEFNKNLVGLLDKVSKNAPAGSDVAVQAVKSALAAANTAYYSFNKGASQGFLFIRKTGDRPRFSSSRRREKRGLSPVLLTLFFPPPAERDDPQLHLLDSWRHFFRCSPHPEFDMTAHARLAHTGQAERLQAAVALFHFYHQRRDDRFR